MLDEGKEVTARALTEQFIRDEKSIEAYNQLEIFCEQLLARLEAVSRERTMPKDLIVCLCSIVYASARINVEELKKVAAYLELKYGTLWADSCHSNLHGQVHEQVFSNLGIGRSPSAVVDKTMLSIAKEFEIDWSPLVPSPSEQEMALIDAQSLKLHNLSVHPNHPMPSGPSVEFSSPSDFTMASSAASSSLNNTIKASQYSPPTSSQAQQTVTQAKLKVSPSPSHDACASPPIEFISTHSLAGSLVDEELLMIDMLPNVPTNMVVSLDLVPIANEGGVIVHHEDDDDEESLFMDGTGQNVAEEDEQGLYDAILDWDDIPDAPSFHHAHSSHQAPSFNQNVAPTKDASQANASFMASKPTTSLPLEDPLLARFNRLKGSN